MPVYDEIDVTPDYTFSTVQFQNETANVLVLSLVAVLTLANIGSIVSKLVYFTPETRFNFRSWVRAFIFANSDDPVRLLSWLARRYDYRNQKWQRNPHKFRPGRLFYPLLARTIVLICSIASIIITLPGEKSILGCTSGDYALSINVTEVGPLPFRPQGICVTIPLKSRRGDVRSTVSFCDCPTSNTLDLQVSAIYVALDEDVGRILMNIVSQGKMSGKASYVEWKSAGTINQTFRTNPSTINPKDIADVALRAISSRRPTCSVATTNATETQSGRNFYMILDNCIFEPEKEIEEVSSFVKNALTWLPTDNLQHRIKFNGADNEGLSDDCPIDISVSRPIVNILPLAIVLCVWFVINIIVSIAVMKHGNALDAGFHIIKEALGHDTSSNPFEASRDQQEIMEVELKNWLCTTHSSSRTGGHRGFIGRLGDIPVDELDTDVVVGECCRAAIELERARTSWGHQVPGSPDSSVSMLSPPGSSGPTLNGQNLHGTEGAAPSTPVQTITTSDTLGSGGSPRGA